MVFAIVTVQEMAKICGVSEQSIYKRIRQFNQEELNQFVNFIKPRGKRITSDGVRYFKSFYGVADEPQQEEVKQEYNNSADSEVIAILKEELRIKNEQIAMLMEQNRNFQVLLHKAEELKALPEVKKSFLSRLFSRKE